MGFFAPGRIASLPPLALFLAAITFAQPAPKTPEIDQIKFSGNSAFDDGALKSVIGSKETSGGFSRFFYKIFGGKIGSPPEFLDQDQLEEDKRLLSDFYRNNGFYEMLVSSDTHLDTGANKATIHFAIAENRQSLVDTITYKGLDSLPEEVRMALFKEPLLQQSKPYQSARASAEIARILEFLNNSGYPAARFDEAHSSAVRYISTNNFSVRYSFIPGKRYQFGETSVRVDPPREDITPDLALRQLDFETGDIYSREKRLSSERNLNRLGIFESARVESAPDSSSARIPIEITVRPRIRNELSPELLVSDEGGFLNLGTGLDFTNRNFFGDARTFTAQTRLRTQDIFGWDFGNVFGGSGLRDSTVKGAVELQFQILQPYLFTRTLGGSWTSSISAEKQKAYILSILRNKIGLSKQFASYTYGFAEWTLERVSPEILLPSAQPDTILRQEDQPQFNSILTLTLQRDKTNDIFSPTDGFFESISLEESGVLPKILPGIRSGLPFTQYYKVTLLGKLYHDLTSTRYNILALKLKTGYQDKYGESKYSDVRIPLTRRYFSGGSNSVRGWKARELGAMSSEFIQFGGNFILEGSVEMRVNHFRGFGKWGFIKPENIWGVYFVDFGNIWSSINDVKFRQVAVAAGFGFRYESFFGPFRVDYGFRLYDPTADVARQSIFQKPFWSGTFGQGVFHFGIGHAF